MTLDTQHAGRLLQDFELRRLFIDEVGWDKPAGRPSTVEIDGVAYILTPIAEKRSVQIFECSGADLPIYATRQKIDRIVRKLSHEHLVVFTDAPKTKQVWQWAARGSGGPIVYREHHYYAGQSPMAMLQKLAPITFVIDDEEGLTLLDVTTPLRLAFSQEAVTARFYDRFKSEHEAFLACIGGICDTPTMKEDSEWYASLMLNRLMFVYFVQKKGFLDGDVNYLRNRLASVRSLVGPNEFHSFYRSFLTHLFHDGLGSQERSTKIQTLIGSVPYLNGGLFEVHELESRYRLIDIPDDAFVRLFDFFDAYQWHLDDRPTSEGNEINPDVLGYIFEKYINQKQMGAYYTKEDITEYMSRSTLVPVLIGKILDACGDESPESEIWDLLTADPDRYVFQSVQAAEGLPGEAEAETAHRLERLASAREELRGGGVKSVERLLSLNLDVRQFAQDIVEQTDHADLVRRTFAILTGMRILDPMCGSGAFLFSALSVLEPIYEACLDRMASFVAESHGSADYGDFQAILGALALHPNRRYYVMKRIIVDNLHGVDLMDEAVEICKLRLFLRLVAQVDDASQLEPLPDIDFNIRHGNSLVGFSDISQVHDALSSRLDFGGAVERIEAASLDVEAAFVAFRDAQLGSQDELAGAHAAKANLRRQLELLGSELDGYLAEQYGASDVELWRQTHQPFHWLIEFHEIVSQGGFDAIIGNPPYVAMSKVRSSYAVRGFVTESCPDIYAPCMERSVRLLADHGRLAMIVPISFQFSDDFIDARKVFAERFAELHVSTFSRNPAALFSAGLGVRNTIVVGAGRLQDGEAPAVRTTSLLRWIEEARPLLFEGLQFALLTPALLRYGWPRSGDPQVVELLSRLVESGGCLEERVVRRGSYRMGYKTTALYYVSAFAEDPPAYSMQGLPEAHTKIGSTFFADEGDRDLAIAVALSKQALLWWACTGDDFDVTARGLMSTPIAPWRLAPETRAQIEALSKRIQGALGDNVIYTKYAGKMMGNYDIKCLRDLTDEVDHLLLGALGLEEFWPTLELFYVGFAKQVGERPGTVRELPSSFFGS